MTSCNTPGTLDANPKTVTQTIFPEFPPDVRGVDPRCINFRGMSDILKGIGLMRTGWSFKVGLYPDMYDLWYNDHLILRSTTPEDLFARFVILCQIPPDGREILEARYQ